MKLYTHYQGYRKVHRVRKKKLHKKKGPFPNDKKIFRGLMCHADEIANAFIKTIF